MAEARQETPMDTDAAVSVTTISTVAVQSGRAKIILAILKVSSLANVVCSLASVVCSLVE